MPLDFGVDAATLCGGCCRFGLAQGVPMELPRLALGEPDALRGPREALRALCAGLALDYFREIDRAGGYPDAFVVAPTEAGWLAALIPPEVGGSGELRPQATRVIEPEAGTDITPPTILTPPPDTPSRSSPRSDSPSSPSPAPAAPVGA